MSSFKDDDIFQREQLAKQLTRLIDNRKSYGESDTLVIALDSGWGSGKTTFVSKWQNQLSSDNQYRVVNYNAWNDDGFSNPLIAIMNQICDEFQDDSNNVEILSKIKYCAGKISLLLAKGFGKKFLKDKMDVDIEEIKKVFDDKVGTSVDEIANIISNATSNEIFDEYESYNSLRDNLRKLLIQISSEKPLIFIIDELDRCRPTYAIEVLETIKHFFDLYSVSFVLSIDLEQLSHSIATVYGQNMDSDGYLRKFFDINLRIPDPSRREYIELCNSKYDIWRGADETDIMTDMWNQLFTKLSCSPRDIDRILKNLRLLMDTSLYEEGNTILKETVEFYTHMLILKYKYREKYQLVLSGRFLSSSNSGSGTYMTLEDVFFSPSDTIKSTMKVLENDGNRKWIDKSEVYFFEPNVTLHQAVTHIRRGEYIERKLELFNSVHF